jgi:hypothetical protein
MAFLRDEQGRVICKDGTPAKRRDRGGPARKKNIGHSSVDKALGGRGPLRGAYEKLLGEPNTTIRTLIAWFKERGHCLSHGAIDRHRRVYLHSVEKVRESALIAHTFCDILRKNGAGALVEASQGRLEMMMMHDVFKLSDQPDLPPDKWHAWSKAMKEIVGTRRNVDTMREESERKEKEAAQEKLDPREVSRRVADQVREILGVNF